MHTFTHTVTDATTTPDLLFPWKTSQQSSTIVQPILNSSEPWVSLGPAALREGSFECLYLNESDAIAARELFTTPGVISLDYAERPSIEMSFVVTRAIDLERLRTRVTRWLLIFSYQEVSA